MIPQSAAVVVMSRAPVPGETKTRLIPTLGAERAARLHRHMLDSTVRAATAANLGPVIVACTPDDTDPFFGWLRETHGVLTRAQGVGDLGARMRRVLEQGLVCSNAAMVVGSDCPGLCQEDFERGFEFLRTGYDVVVGPSTDGGYYLLGLRASHPSLFENIDWGTSNVLAQTEKQLRADGCSYGLLSERTDVDVAADLQVYPRLLNRL